MCLCDVLLIYSALSVENKCLLHNILERISLNPTLIFVCSPYFCTHQCCLYFFFCLVVMFFILLESWVIVLAFIREMCVD